MNANCSLVVPTPTRLTAIGEHPKNRRNTLFLWGGGGELQPGEDFFKDQAFETNYFAIFCSKLKVKTFLFFGDQGMISLHIFQITEATDNILNGKIKKITADSASFTFTPMPTSHFLRYAEKQL